MGFYWLGWILHVENARGASEGSQREEQIAEMQWLMMLELNNQWYVILILFRRNDEAQGAEEAPITHLY